MIGIDEVGRGPLAGPVTVGAVIMPLYFTRIISRSSFVLKDSKKLTPKQREEWFKWIRAEEKKKKVFWAVASVSPRTIDTINISRSANRAAGIALKKLKLKSGFTGKYVNLFLDGGLFVDKKVLESLSIPYKKAKTVIKGDERIPVVSLASIVAKVKRDAYMNRLHIRHPEYGFEKHKGYGTKEHGEAVRKHGPSHAHRLTFLGSLYRMKR